MGQLIQFSGGQEDWSRTGKGIPESDGEAEGPSEMDLKGDWGGTWGPPLTLNFLGSGM